MVCMAGGSWYVPAEALSTIWAAAAKTLSAGIPVFLTETQSKTSPDQHLSFFIDFDATKPMPSQCLQEFIVDAIDLVDQVFARAGCSLQLPASRACLTIAVAMAPPKFGCHVVLNSVLTDTATRAYLTGIANELWSDYGWGSAIIVDKEAVCSFRALLSNKVARYPVLERKPVPVDQGRAYEIVCVCDYVQDTGFVLAPHAEILQLAARPFTFPTLPTFRTDQVVHTNGITTSATVSVSMAEDQDYLTPAKHQHWLRGLLCQIDASAASPTDPRRLFSAFFVTEDIARAM